MKHLGLICFSCVHVKAGELQDPLPYSPEEVVVKPVASKEMRTLSQMAEDDMMVATNEL